MSIITLNSGCLSSPHLTPTALMFVILKLKPVVHNKAIPADERTRSGRLDIIKRTLCSYNMKSATIRSDEFLLQRTKFMCFWN